MRLLHLISFVGLIGLVGCADSTVHLTPKYQPKQLDPYRFETFVREWQTVAEIAGEEVTVLRDLLARAPTDFDYPSLWTAFANRSLHLPQTPESWQLLYEANLPTCNLETLDSFTEFAVSLLFEAPDATRFILKSLRVDCEKFANVNHYVRLAQTLMQQKNEPSLAIADSEKNILLVALIRKTQNHESQFKILQPKLGWSTYLKSILEKASNDFEKNGEGKSLLRLYDQAEYASLEMKSERPSTIGLVPRLILEVKNFDNSILHESLNRWGIETALNFIAATKGVESFFELSPENQREFLNFYINSIPAPLDKPKKLAYQLQIERWMKSLEAEDLVRNYLSIMNSAGEHLGALAFVKYLYRFVPPNIFAQLDPSLQNKLISHLLNQDLSDHHDWLTTLLIVADYLVELPLKQVAATYLNHIDKSISLRLRETEISNLAINSIFQNEFDVMRHRIPGFTRWLITVFQREYNHQRNFFEEEFDRNHRQAARDFFNEEEVEVNIDNLFFLRAELRRAQDAQFDYTRALTKICEFYQDHGLSSGEKVIKESELKAQKLLLKRGCISLSKSSQPFELILAGNEIFSPDTILLTMGRDIHIRSNGGTLQNLYVNSTPDPFFSINSDLVSVLPAPEEHHAVSFPIVLGYSDQQNKTWFFPFHYIFKRRQGPFESITDSSIEPTASGGRILLSSVDTIYHSSFISQGSDGRPGKPAVMGGHGDLSFAYAKDESNRSSDSAILFRGIEADYQKLGAVEVVAQPSELYWKKFKKDLQEKIDNNEQSSVFIDTRFFNILHEEDFSQLTQALESLRIQYQPEEHRIICETLAQQQHYAFLLNDSGELIDDFCRDVFALRLLATSAVEQLLRLKSDPREEPQLHSASDYENEINPTPTAGLPGSAFSAGDGGEISLQARSFVGVYANVQPGIRFIWSSSLIGQSESSLRLNGGHGSEGFITLYSPIDSGPDHEISKGD